MSGDRPVVLVAEVGSVVHRGVAKLGMLVTLLPPFAVIGGLAVILRLGQAHRATNDIDAVSDDQAAVLEMLVAKGYPRRGESVVLEPDLKLDVIDVSEGDPEYLPFLTHRYAFETRTILRVEAVDAAIVRSSVHGLGAIAPAQIELLGRARTPSRPPAS